MAGLWAVRVGNFLVVVAFLLSSSSAEKTLRKEVNRRCFSFVLNTMGNNVAPWYTIPPKCEHYIKKYMENRQYESDMETTAFSAMDYLSDIVPDTDGKDAVVFDIDETCLSNLKLYREVDYGLQNVSGAQWNAWSKKAEATALPHTLILYNFLKSRGWTIIFITGRNYYEYEATKQNLLDVGYENWAHLILRSEKEANLKALDYKSAHRTNLVKTHGYRIRSAFGDQWSDITGPYVGERQFKFSNPMYYIA